MKTPLSPNVTVPVTEEQLEIHREIVDTGHTMRLRKHVEQFEAAFDEHLAREHIEVDRHPIGRVVKAIPPVRQEGDVIIVSVVEERLVTSRELVLVEEIRLTLRRETTRVQGEVPLRRERVVIERLDPETNQWRAEGPETKDLKE
jgi:uncharacterized protein (TIGR02271 family)